MTLFLLRSVDILCLIYRQVGQFLALSKEKFHLRTSHSLLLGYWTAELGALNQVVHLWQYGGFSSTIIRLEALRIQVKHNQRYHDRIHDHFKKT